MNKLILLNCLCCMASVYGMNFKIVDLAYDLNNDTLHWPTATAFQLFVQHKGLVKPDKEEDEGNYWYEMNDFKMGEHVGTHLDAPIHFARKGWSVAEIPLERFISPVVVIDLRKKIQDNPDYEITTEDLLEWESSTNQTLSHMAILWTGWSSRWQDKKSYFGTSTNDTSMLHFPGLHPDAAQWLVDNRDMHGLGIDTASIDYGQSKAYKSHRILFAKNVIVLENLNTNSLVTTDLSEFKRPYLYINPLKITAGSGSPIRPLMVDMSSMHNNDAGAASLSFFCAAAGLVIFYCL